MSRLTHYWQSGIRLALVAVALLATLTSSFGFHLHASSAHAHEIGANAETHSHDHHDQVATKFTGELTDDGTGGLGSELDPDGCGHCHCQLPAADLPSVTASLVTMTHGDALLMPSDLSFVGGISHEPDPPPIRG